MRNPESNLYPSSKRAPAFLLLALFLAGAGCRWHDDDEVFVTTTDNSISIYEERNHTSGVSQYSWNTAGSVARVEMVIDDFYHGYLRILVYGAGGAKLYDEEYYTYDWYWYGDDKLVEVNFTAPGDPGLWTIALDYYHFAGDVHLSLINTEEAEPEDVVDPPSDYSPLLDPSFGSNGLATYTPVTALGKMITVDSQNRIVVAGTLLDSQGLRHLAVWRFLASGQLDTTFGTDGLYYFMETTTSCGEDLVIAAGDKIVVSGWVGNPTNRTDLAVLRLTDSGAPDPTFGLSGRVTLDDGAEEIGAAVALDGSGNILVAGSSQDEDNLAGYMLLARYSSTGILDPTFGTNGLIRTLTPSDRGWDLAVDTANRPVVMGVRNNGLILWRFTTTGGPDTTFSGSGLVTSNGDVGQTLTGRALRLKSDGSLAVTGLRLYDLETEPTEMVLWRFLADGMPDPSFNGSGFLAYRYPGGTASGSDVGFDSLGRILVIGETQATGMLESDASATLWRFLPTGSLDGTLPTSNFTGVARFDERTGDVSTGSAALIITGTDQVLVTGGVIDHTISAVDLVAWKLLP